MLHLLPGRPLSSTAVSTGLAKGALLDYGSDVTVGGDLHRCATGLCRVVPVALAVTSLRRSGTERQPMLRRKSFEDISRFDSDQKPIDRTFINSWEDRRVVEAVKNTGRKK